MCQTNVLQQKHFEQSRAGRMTDGHLRDPLFWLLRGLLTCFQSETNFSPKLNSYVLEGKKKSIPSFFYYEVFVFPPVTGSPSPVSDFHSLRLQFCDFTERRSWALPGLPVELCVEETPLSALKEVPWPPKATQLLLLRGGDPPLSPLLTETSGAEIN